MIPTRGFADFTSKNTQSDWDLTSSVTGTVKRRPTSLESCKSNSPTKNDDGKGIDFPDGTKDDVAKEAVSASCKINKPLRQPNAPSDLSQEIAGGSSTIGNGNDETNLNGRRRKINKKRFFDLKLPESAKKTFTSKLKLPNRVSLTLSPRKTSPRNKLSLSQLEQQNNLFIRDGQHPNDNNGSGGEKINKQDTTETEVKNNKIFEDASPAAMERAAEGNNPQKKQESSSGGNQMTKNKKSSLIPAFLGGSAKASPANHIKIQATSAGSAKKASSTTVVEKLTKTGNKFKELYRDFPSNGEKSSNLPKNSLKRNPPPYRPPPTPSLSKQTQSNVERQKRIRFSENDAKNYEEIDVISEENVIDRDKRVVDADDNSFSVQIDEDMNAADDSGEPRPEYSSNVFKNIPVRQKKGTVSHMENYCLFDPSVDFCNEKELLKKKLAQSRMSEINAVRQQIPKNLQLNDCEESIEDVTFEDQTVYDVSELDEREQILAHHNYYEIDPDLLLEEEENAVALVQQNVVKEKRSQSVASKHRKSKIYSNQLSTSSESTSTSQTSTNSSSTATSSDYPSLFNSVIETTHSSTVESTDDNESNGYGKVKTPPANDKARQFGDTIDQVNVTAVANESIITISNVVTCGESNASSTGATKKKSPQLNRIIRPSSSSSTRNASSSQKQSKQQQTSALAGAKPKSNKVSAPLHNKSLQLDPLKSSHSLPHLENVTIQNRCRQQSNEINFVIDNTTTIHLRRQHNSRVVNRPLSGHSDDRDSGFLSPVTPPDSQNPAHITPNVIVKEPAETATKTESTLLNQVDNIQQLIEVSNQSGTFPCV